MSSNPITLTEVEYDTWCKYSPFTEKTFITLWQQCDNIVQFRESYAHHHRGDWSPTEISCYNRRKSIERRYGVKLRTLKTAAQYNREKYRMEIIQLVNQFEEQNEI